MGWAGIQKTSTIRSDPDLDPGDQRLDQGLALVRGAGADDVIDVLCDLQERGSWRRGQLVAAGAQLRCAGLEMGEPGGEVFLVKAALLERSQVAVCRGAGPGQLVLRGGQLRAPAVHAGCLAGCA
jgi:hypothetical protein